MCGNISSTGLLLLMFVTVLYGPQFAFGETEVNCTNGNCDCCIENICGKGMYFTDECTRGCIDGHRGARCHLLCENNCKACANHVSVCTACYDGQFLDGNVCVQCPTNCKTCTSDTMCDSCKDGFENTENSKICQYSICPEHCVCNNSNCIACESGFFDTGNSCNNKCPDNCITCLSLKECVECREGFYNGNNGNKAINGNNMFLSDCTHECRDTCVHCSSYDQCLQCALGKYGQKCQYDCSGGCKDKICLIDTGACDCSPSFDGDNCDKCVLGRYGDLCEKPCPSHCKNKMCERPSGNCKEGCISDHFTGVKCDTCFLGKYGESCNETCPLNCKQNMCERKDGNCSNGCVGQFGGTRCTECVSGKYGKECNFDCPEKCFNGLCDNQLGNCLKCTGNFDGAKCNICKSGFYGKECNHNCSLNCLHGICDKSDGKCADGCKENFSGDMCCAKSKHCANCQSNTECGGCKSGYFGRLCENRCPDNCKGGCEFSDGICNACKKDFYGLICNFNCSDHCNVPQDVNVSRCASEDGECLFRCEDGYFGSTCNNTCSGICVGNVCTKETGLCLKGCDVETDDPVCGVKEELTPAPKNIVGPVVGGTVALGVIVVCSIVAVFFYKRRHPRKESDSSSNIVKKPSKRKRETTQTVEERHMYANIRGHKQRENSRNIEEIEVDVEDVVVNEKEDENTDEATDYYNINPDQWRIKVEDLFSYVTKDHVELFAKDFQNLPKPDDLSEVCKVAKKPENIALNRYNGVYPFDHSRVTIPGQPRFFINACYMDGYNKKKAYIASFGPTEKTTEKFTTFWRMIWHENSEIIVMLTNLREASGMKCEQYWPEKGEEHYDHIKVECRSVEVFAEYTVRIFTISKGKERRNLTHLHYTAWPDKGVPSEVTSLVEFRQRVKAVPIVLDGPVVVHCSAGVGRTGTYIALDILTNEGETEGSVKVFNCVSKMREQRVNMVQTAEQYKYLHKALVHALTFECEAIIAEEVQSLAFEADDMFNRMFRTLQYEVDKEKDYEVAAREENRKAHADKSRRHSDVPGDRGRVRLFLRRKTGSHDYINAVFINSFKIKNLFIAAQSPLSGTVEDFLCMIYQQDSSCVIALESLQQPFKQNDVGEYLPADNETYRCGSFTVTSSKYETKPQYIVKKLSIQNAEKREDKTVYHFQYTKWGKGQNVAESARDFVHFVKEVEKYVNERAEDTPNIVVHCLNGYERSGLFCVVYTLLEKLEAERQVSVVNIIRRVRAQRKRSVSNTEQLKFCFQCISAYLESYNTYSNFAT